VGADIREGKKTLLISYAMDHASPQEKEFIRRSLGNDAVTMEELQRVKDIIVDCGSLGYSEERISRLTEEAMKSLREGPEELVMKYAPLGDFAHYILQRKQ
jgi:geranylgeranyl diphosphate synthase type I